MSYTLAEVSEKTGKSQANLRKLIERGQLRAEKEAGRLMVTDEALEDFMGGEVLEEAAEEVRQGRTHEVGNVITRLPSKVLTAILEGIPTAKKPGGSPDAYRKAVEGIPKNPPQPDHGDDPHFGFEVGHKHVDAPRWKRTSKTTWSLGDASYVWNGFLWEGGGSRAGTALEVGISPADPDVHYRPLAPAPSASKTK